MKSLFTDATKSFDDFQTPWTPREKDVPTEIDFAIGIRIFGSSFSSEQAANNVTPINMSSNDRIFFKSAHK